MIGYVKKTKAAMLDCSFFPLHTMYESKPLCYYKRVVNNLKKKNKTKGRKKMTNFEIIAEYIEQNEIDFEYDGNNLQTFAAWKKVGMSVKKGEKAFMKIDLWTCKLVEDKDEEGKVVIDEKTKKPKMKKKFFLKSAALFTTEQVEKIKKGQAA